MPRRTDEPLIEYMGEWLTRMEVVPEELGLARNDADWRYFVEDKLTEHLGFEPTIGQVNAMAKIGQDIAREVGYSVLFRETETGGYYTFRSIITGRFISREQAMTAYDFFIESHRRGRRQ